MVAIAVSELRSQLPSFLRRVERGEVVVVISRGREVARIMPPAMAMLTARKGLRKLRIGSVVKDVVSPVSRGWKAAR